ncbi:MAG TPA: DNA-formamidopyrimidine glycosylase family protein [Candidatus Udaeobacter sp.]|jgi:formamidopyrimidine-DNA glycosylase|nr:DNA-formamidopyrimidine glycosylase family protein [Candidatus Udaeobacter sp.]
MPELPEVEIFKRYLDRTSLHQRIVGVDVQRPYVLKDISARDLARQLKGRCFESSRRHGKHLFVRAGRDLWLRLHFGMTGSLKYLKPDDQTPPYAQVLFTFQKNRRLAFDDPRQFGEIGLVDDADEFLKKRAVGADALDIGFSKFRDIFKENRGSVKSVLLNQKLIAGIGNLYADEILFRTRVHPATELSRLRDTDVARLFTAARYILEKTIQVKANADRTPRGWLLRQRGKGGKCPRCNRELKSATIGGRTAWFCAHCQKSI